MLWLVFAILAYFLLAVVALIDKYLISGPIPHPKVYAFYVGALGLLALFLIPLGFSLPDPLSLLLAIFAGAIYIFGLYVLIFGLSLFEASRLMPAIGGISPFFTLIFTALLLAGKEAWGFWPILSFFLLIFGSILITLEREKKVTLKSLKISTLTAFLFALSFLLAKFVYLGQSFWSGFIWMRIGGFFPTLFLFFSKEVREEIFRKRISFKPKTGAIFLSSQTLGAIGFIFQNWAIALVPFSFLPFIFALEGTKYLFLLILAIFFSLKFPQILKEEISKKIIFQKAIAIFLIGMGFALLAFK